MEYVMYEIDLCLKYRRSTHCLNEELGNRHRGKEGKMKCSLCGDYFSVHVGMLIMCYGSVLYNYCVLVLWVCD